MISATCGGIGAVQTFSNRHLTVGLDGIVEMSEDVPAQNSEFRLRRGYVSRTNITRRAASASDDRILGFTMIGAEVMAVVRTAMVAVRRREPKVQRSKFAQRFQRL